MIKVKELIKILQKLNPEAEVLIAKEFDEVSLFSCCDKGYHAYNNEYKEFFFEHDLEEILEEKDITLQEFIKKAEVKECIVMLSENKCL